METISKYSNLYKISTNCQGAQEERRRKILQLQRDQRHEVQDGARNLKDFIKRIHKNYERKKIKKYKTDHMLQLSEWLLGRPDDLDRWFLVPCPKGQRCLLVATDGRTEVYNKRGKFQYTFTSNLPGCNSDASQYTVLDCVYVEKASTFYVLDIIAYNNIDMLSCEAQFRFFWLNSKFVECPELSTSVCNNYHFTPLNFYDFEDLQSINSCLLRYPQFSDNRFEFDGFLFYHKEASYMYGETPLVGWLFAFMVPEVLKYNVHEAYMEEMPTDYTNCFEFSANFDNALIEKSKLRQRNNRTKNKSYSSEEMITEVLDVEQELEITGQLIDDFIEDEN